MGTREGRAVRGAPVSEAVKNRRAEDYEDFFEGTAPAIWGPLAVVDEEKPMWLTRHPGADDHHGRLATLSHDSKHHRITENHDGSLTVDGEDGGVGSILCRHCGWHGFLTAGEWTEA